MQRFELPLDEFSPWLAAFLDADHVPDLGPGRPRHGKSERLANATDMKLFDDRPVVDTDMAGCCRAGLWLWCDDLDRSHEISQQIASPSGSYWHAIMHRREPDFDNAKYWVRRVGDHPVYEPLAAAVVELARDGTDARLAPMIAPRGGWDPNAFVDQCRRYAGTRSHEEEICRQVAWLEWQLLFEYCYRMAIGRTD